MSNKWFKPEGEKQMEIFDWLISVTGIAIMQHMQF